MNAYAGKAVTARPDRSYLATRVLTAPPQALVLMLFDGALRETARARSIDPGQPGGRERLHRALTRAQGFIRELLLALDRERGGELAGRLAALYLFCQQKLIEANVKADPARCDEVLRVLRPLRDAWAEICGAAGQASGPAAGRGPAPENGHGTAEPATGGSGHGSGTAGGTPVSGAGRPAGGPPGTGEDGYGR